MWPLLYLPVGDGWKMWRLVGCWTHEVRAILGCPAVPRCLRRAWRNLRPMSSRPESQVAKGDWFFMVFQCVCVLQGQYGQNIWFGENSTISDVRIGWWSQFFRDGWNESKSSQEWPCSTTLPASLYSVTFTEYHRLLFSLQLQKRPVVSKMSCVHPCNVFPSPTRIPGHRESEMLIHKHCGQVPLMGGR